LGVNDPTKNQWLKKSWEQGTDFFDTEHPVWEGDNVTEFAKHSLETDDFWKCDSYQVYSVGTSRVGATASQITLYQDDILIGFRSSDTGGITTDFGYNPNHKIRFTIEHRDMDGRSLLQFLSVRTRNLQNYFQQHSGIGWLCHP